MNDPGHEISMQALVEEASRVKTQNEKLREALKRCVQVLEDDQSVWTTRFKALQLARAALEFTGQEKV